MPHDLLVCAGGQTGVDQSAWLAAEAVGFPTSGWMPRGFLTEEGPRPEFAKRFNAIEHESPSYPPRTGNNVRMADATVWLGPVGVDGFGFGRTKKEADLAGKPFCHVGEGRPISTALMLARLIRNNGWKTINFAGSRESKQPGIGARSQRFLEAVFKILKEDK